MIKLYISPCTKETEHQIGAKLAEYAFLQVYGKAARLSHHENGKPHFETEEKTFVSISHSRDYCVAAISNKEVGVDIEFMAQKTNLTEIAKRYFTEREAEYVSECPTARFYEIWCKKESYMKYTGEGFSRSMSSFSVFEGEIGYSHLVYGEYYVAVCSPEKCNAVPVFVNL